MSDKQINNNQKKENKQPANHKQLLGQVVLLIGNDSAVLQSLVTQLASRGADVALLCWQLPRETARKIKESAQSLGRRLLLIEQRERDAPTTTQLVKLITTELGRLDIYIDLSAQKLDAVPQENGHKVRFNYPNWQLTQAVLEELGSP